jgi:hypothetical protein
MNGPQRLLESDAGPLSDALKQARAHGPSDVRLARIAENLAGQGLPIDPGAVPAAPTAAPGWSLGAKLVTGLLGALVVAAVLVAGLRASGGESAAWLKASPSLGSMAAVTSVAADERAHSPSEIRRSAGSESSRGQSLPEPPSEGQSATPLPQVSATPPPSVSATPSSPREDEPPAAARASAERADSAPSFAKPATERSVVSEATGASGGRSASTERGVIKPRATPPAGDTSEREPEIGILADARSALSGNPAAALALTERHRSLYPRGSFVQERELIAITALTRLGQAGPARDRAARFRASYPRSAYLKQLDRLVGAP